MLGILVICKECERTFYVCRSCWRGQKYCSTGCRNIGYRKRQVAAQLKYQATHRAKLLHAKRQQKFSLSKNKITKIMTHKTSTHLKPEIKAPLHQRKRCSVCSNPITETYENYYQLKEHLRFYGKT